MKIVFSKNFEKVWATPGISVHVASQRWPAFIFLPCGEHTKFMYIQRKGIVVHHETGWNGSYHDPQKTGSYTGVYICAINKKAGWLGRMRKTAAEIKESFVVEAAEEQIGKTIAIRKGVWREEGD